jgi:hypothetical protein
MRSDDFEIFDYGEDGGGGWAGIILSDVNEFCFCCAAGGKGQGSCIACIILSPCYISITNLREIVP